MGFKELASLDAEVVITIGGRDKKTGKPNPTGAEGYYLGNRVVKGSKYGDSTIHFLQTAKGNVGVWGKTNLNNKLAAVEAGTMIRIGYAGLKATKNGDMHAYKVEVDTDNTIDVSALEATDLEGSTKEFDSEERDYSSDESEDSAEYEAVETPTVRASNTIAGKTQAERKAEVQALLRGNKAKN